VACEIFATKSYHLIYTAKWHSGAARQSAHRTPTPRVGGIATFSGFIAGTAMLPSDVAAYAMPLLLSCIAVFIGGLGEDIGRDVSPKNASDPVFYIRALRDCNYSGLDRPPGISLFKLDYLNPSWGDCIHCVDLGWGGACDKSD